MQVISKKVRSLYPSGVTIIATVDGDGRPRGFTAGSFTWLSSTPPLVAFCLAQSANSFSAFSSADGFSVNLLRAEHKELAERFATKGIDKFSGGEFTCGEGGYPTLHNAVVALQCRVRERMTGGAHLFIVGEVIDCRFTEDALPMVMYRDAFQTLAPVATYERSNNGVQHASDLLDLSAEHRLEQSGVSGMGRERRPVE